MADDTSTASTTDTGTADGDQGSATDTADDTPQGLGDAGKAALDKERAAARDAAKQTRTVQRERDALKAELDKLREASMSEQEKAVKLAREEGAAEARTAALREIGGRLVTTELRAALAGRMDDAQRTALLDGIDRSRFLTDDGDVDIKAIARWADAVAPTRAPSFDGGARGGVARPTGMSALIRERAGR